MSEQQIFAKCAWRLIPFMMVLYIINFFDRVNVGFAALTMNKDLGFSPTVYGFGAGVFFVGIAIFCVPSTVMVAKVGARRWTFLILAIWGLISASCALIRTPAAFYVLRFLLGVAEAGFVPGMVYYLSCWFPPSYRGRYLASFLTAAPLSIILGGPLSGLILTAMDGFAGIRGCQWLFVIEGAPATVLAFAVLKWLPDGPAHASWLTLSEKEIVAGNLARHDVSEHSDFWRALLDFRVLALGFINAGILVGTYGSGLWMPQFVQAMGFSTLATGFVVALPYLATMGVMVAWGRSSDAKGDRIWHVALASLIAGAGFAVASVSTSNLLSMIALTFGVMGIYCTLGPLISLPSEFLGDTAAAGGIGLVYALASLGAFVGPFLIGLLKEQTGGYAAGMMVLAAGMIVAAGAALMLGRAMSARTALVKTLAL